MFVLLLMVGVVLAGDGRRRVLHLPGDLLLGGLFPMHEQVRQIQRQRQTQTQTQRLPPSDTLVDEGTTTNNHADPQT